MLMSVLLCVNDTCVFVLMFNASFIFPLRAIKKKYFLNVVFNHFVSGLYTLFIVYT